MTNYFDRDIREYAQIYLRYLIAAFTVLLGGILFLRSKFRNLKPPENNED